MQVEKLVKAGLLIEKELNDEIRRRVETLTDDEIKALISVKQKLGYRGTLHVYYGGTGGVL